jgi:hypothetical protein
MSIVALVIAPHIKVDGDANTKTKHSSMIIENNKVESIDSDTTFFE